MQFISMLRFNKGYLITHTDFTNYIVDMQMFVSLFFFSANITKPSLY